MSMKQKSCKMCGKPIPNSIDVCNDCEAESGKNRMDKDGRITPVFNDFDKEFEAAGRKRGNVTVFGTVKGRDEAKRKLESLENRLNRRLDSLSQAEEDKIIESIPFVCAACGKKTKSKITAIQVSKKRGCRFCSYKCFNNWEPEKI